MRNLPSGLPIFSLLAVRTFSLPIERLLPGLLYGLGYTPAPPLILLHEYKAYLEPGPWIDSGVSGLSVPHEYRVVPVVCQYFPAWRRLFQDGPGIIGFEPLIIDAGTSTNRTAIMERTPDALAKDAGQPPLFFIAPDPSGTLG
jgi:hypothetical protein